MHLLPRLTLGDTRQEGLPAPGVGVRAGHGPPASPQAPGCSPGAAPVQTEPMVGGRTAAHSPILRPLFTWPVKIWVWLPEGLGSSISPCAPHSASTSSVSWQRKGCSSREPAGRKCRSLGGWAAWGDPAALLREEAAGSDGGPSHARVGSVCVSACPCARVCRVMGETRPTP